MPESATENVEIPVLWIDHLRGDAEVQDLRIPFLRDHDVGALQVSMNHLMLLRVPEGTGDLSPVAPKLIGRERLMQESLERLPRTYSMTMKAKPSASSTL